MNSYQNYQNGSIQNNRIRQNDMRNYVYNRANQNIDHLRENFNNKQNEAPIRIMKNKYRNESNEISSILNNDPYKMNKRFNESNSSNNYNSTNYSSFQNNNVENKYPNNNDINRHSQYSGFYNRNNNSYNEINNYQPMPPYPRNSNMNSMNNINRMKYNIESHEMINFNGLNLNIGSKINNNNHHNNYNNFPGNNSYENNFRRSKYSNKSENISIGNNHYNINLSSITSQDIAQSFEKQKKENERKKKEEYSNILKQQIQEKNKRKELEKQKKLKEEMEYEQKYENPYKDMISKDLDEKLSKYKNNNNKSNDIINNDEQIIKKNNIENNFGNEGNILDKNILETLRKNQYPLINDIKEIENINNKNRKNNYKLENNEFRNQKISTNSSMIKSGLSIIEGNKSKENFYQKEINDEKDINNSNKKIDSNKETELFLDKIIQKTDMLTQTLNKPSVDDDQRMKDIIKVLENKKNDKFNNRDNFEPKNNFTPDKNNIYKNKIKEQEIQDVNLGAINFRSKYENYENIINPNIKNSNKYKQSYKGQYSSHIKNNEETPLRESMKGVSEFITSTSRKKTDNISGINLFNNNNNNKNPTSIFNERKKEKKYILKDDFLQSHNSSNKKSDIVEVKDSLNSNMKITFGLGGDLKFSMANNNPDNYNSKVNESISTFNDTKNQEKNENQYSFGKMVEKEINKNKKRKINSKEDDDNNNKVKEEDEDIDEDDEEKYDIKVNSENDINYDNMLQSTKKSDLKFLDFDQFCDIENDNEENKNKKKRKKKKRNTNKKQNTNINEINETDELCNLTISDEDKDKENNDKSKKDNENNNKLTESKKVQMQLNFFSDSITKGISHKRNDKSIFRRNNENNEDDNINLLSKDSSDKINNKKSENDKDEDKNKNILEESGDLKDSYCDNILKNLDKYRGDFQKD